jgi:uncharacterized tellurite resistance protein B-like protein
MVDPLAFFIDHVWAPFLAVAAFLWRSTHVDLQNTKKELNDLNTLVRERYAKREEMFEMLRRIEDKLDNLRDFFSVKLDSKLDKEHSR